MMQLEIYDVNEIQYLPSFRNLRFAKAFQGGEDLWLSFDLDRDINIDYPDVAYGNVVILRRGLTALWKGAMRAIDQGEETITVNCLGQWVHIDDVNHGEQASIWCDNRYKKWHEINPWRPFPAAGWGPQKFEMRTDWRLYIAPRKGENFGGVLAADGGLYYRGPTDAISRISFDYDLDLAWTTNFELRLQGYTAGMVPGTFWTVAAGTVSAGVKDIPTLIGGVPAAIVYFWMRLTPNPAITYTGETGIDVYAEITNLRLWGQTTESPSIIHVAEAVIDENTQVDASHDRVQEQLFVRDTFTDANGTLLANHQPDVDKERGGWTVVVGGIDIQGNQANSTGVAGNRAVIDSDESDGVICCDFPTPAAGNFNQGLMFRYTNINNYWQWDIDQAGNARLRKVVAGVPTDVYLVNIGMEANFTYHLMVKLRGADIECYIGAILRTSTNDSFNQTATEHGIMLNQQANLRCDNFEVYQAHPIWPMFYEDGESGYGALKDCSSFGDWNYKPIGWGVESGGDRVFVRQADRESVRYVIPPQYVAQATSRGDTQREFYTSAWATYKDEEGVLFWTDKYYVHVTNTGLEVNTTATGDDLASVVYGVDRDHTVDFGRVDQNVAVAYLIQWLMERGHPQVKSSYRVYGPVQDLGRSGSWIDPAEMEVGHVVQIPFFRAVEAEGAVGSDLRDYDTTFFLVGLEHDEERGVTSLIPEGATEDLQRIIAYARAFQKKEEREHITKRSEVIGG